MQMSTEWCGNVHESETVLVSLYVVYVCLTVVIELVWVTTSSHVVNNLTNSSHIFQSDDFEVLYSLAQWVSAVK